MSRENPFLHLPAPDLTSQAKAGRKVKVSFPVSCNYNGGIVRNGEWFVGYVVPEPIVPIGFKLVYDGGGLERNSSPPTCYAYLVPEEL